MKAIHFLHGAIAAVSIMAGNLALADTHRIELGWGNITPCSKVETNNDGWLGLPSVTTRVADQRVTAYAVVDAPTLPGIQNDIQQCAVQGAAAATLGTILTSPAAAMPAFQAQFESCLRERAAEYFSMRLELSDGQCMW